jgi:hypothetical protein
MDAICFDNGDSHGRLSAEFAIIDALPWKWRRLVWEFNWPAVARYLGGELPPEVVRDHLRAKRAKRQQRMLARCG